MIFVFAKAFISIFLDFNLFPLETDFEIFSIFCLFSKFKATQRKKNIKLWMHISGKATLSPFLQIMFKEKVVQWYMLKIVKVNISVFILSHWR